MALNPGGTLLNGQYRILRLLGHGGFGFVYHAEDTLLGEPVAIKELIPALVGDEEILRRFLAEARATIRLRHGRIVGTRHVFHEAGNSYIVMEYLPGGSLEERMREQGPLPVDEAIRVAAEVCEGIGFAHKQGIVHCDLKPANILFDAAGRAKVADFGVAHVEGDMLTRSWHTSAGFVAGTLPYMSPEQTNGVRDDPRLDIYALGAVLYRALTGRTYLDFEVQGTPRAQAENVARIATAQPLPPSRHNRDVPAWLDRVVLRALAKRPGERYASAKAMQEALLQQGPISPQAVTRKRPLPAWFWPAAAAAVALCVLLILVISSLDGGRGADEVAGPGTTEATATDTLTLVEAQASAPSETPAPTPTVTLPPPATEAPTAASTPQATVTAPLPTLQPTVWPSPTATSRPGPYVGQVVTVRVPVADVWPNPRVGGGQKRETQVLMGEQVEITEIRGDWYRVVVLAQPSRKDPRGYPGWVQASDIVLGPYPSNHCIIVMVPSASLRTLPEAGSPIVAEISLDTRLNIIDQASPWIQVTLPNGDQAWIEETLVRVEGGGQSPYKALPDDLVKTARSLVGTPYLWGGSSWKALDCSGVVYRTFHAHGILLARDSRDQAEGGQIVPREALEPGDLVFYAVGGASGTVSHVSLYIGNGQAIATYDGQFVSIRRYDDPNYAKEFWGARRYW